MTFTDEVLDDAAAEILRQKTPAERLVIAFRLWSFAQEMVQVNLRRDHPEWGETELRMEPSELLRHVTDVFERLAHR